MFDALLEADPDFEPTWQAFVAEWADEPDPLLYMALAQLARHLIGKLARRDVARFEAVFDVVEAWHSEGDAYVREAATIGLLEDLQNLNLHTVTTPEQFIPWLRPVSRMWWDKVEAFWERGAPISE